LSASADHSPLTQAQIADIDRLVARYKSERGALLPLLHAIRDELGYVPDAAVPAIAEGLNLSRADVHGVLTFYHDFRRAKAGRHIVKLCRAEACQARKGAANEVAVAERLGVPMGETRADGEVTLEAIYCLGLCANGPAALVDGVPLADATPDAIVEALSPSGDRVASGGVLSSIARALGLDSPLSPEGAREPRRVYISDDMASIALGADKVAVAFEAAGCTVVRTGSRGLFGIEPLVEVESEAGRVGFGPVTADDVAAVLDGTHANRIGDIAALPFFTKQQRFTFARVGITDPLSLEDYAAHDGWKGLNTARAMAPNDVVAQVKGSGLRGRGGAGFPTGIKWQTVLDARGHEKFIVCNADEGDSGTFADRMLMEGDPYCLIEGMAIAGHAVGAAYGYIYIRSEYPHAIAKMEAAIRRSAHIVAPFALEVRTGAGAYVCGEETALLDSIEGKRGQVRAKPPLPAHVGLFGKPTVINNVLSLAAVPFIMAEGAQKYADVGFGRSRGTMPVQLAGNIRNGGLFEIGFGITLGELVDEIGGGTESGRPVKAVQVGGPLGAYFPPSMFHMPFDYETFAQNGGLIGHAGITVFDDTADMAHMARFAMEFCSIESCGKCTPCRIGSTRGVETMDRIIAGGQRGTDSVEALPQIRNTKGGKRSVAQEVEILRDLCDTMKYGSLCALGGFTPYPVLSALDFFPEDFGMAPNTPAEAAE
jgi:formate dehydrogenase iron-sulfur subunit